MFREAVQQIYIEEKKKSRSLIIPAMGIAATVLGILVSAWIMSLPSTRNLSLADSYRSISIYDRNGDLLYEVPKERWYEPVPLENIPPYVVDATIAIEDATFRKHNGVRLFSLLRATKETVIDKQTQGGSTITMQLVKNVLLSPEQTFNRKIKEIVLTFAVEAQYSKEEILQYYMNNVPYGGRAWGIQAAAKKYFDKRVDELSLGEASFLAGLPQAPTAYSPYNGAYDQAKKRQRHVLDRMIEENFITSEEAEQAYAENLVFVPQTKEIKAPHFVFYVLTEMKQKYGEDYVNSHGLEIRTTLDSSIQAMAEQAVAEEVEKNSHLNISNGSALILDPETGEILAYVGSIDYFNEQFGAVDMVRAHRQPGSTLKPVTYALAFQNGYSPASIIADAPVTYVNDWETYKPVNYDRTFHGNVTLRRALANSYNIPAVKLTHQLGPNNVARLAHEMGVTSWDMANDSFGLSVTLGGNETTLYELATVYATLARGGEYVETTPFISIKDHTGKEIYNKAQVSRQVLSPGIAWLVTHILSDNYARIPEFGFNNMLTIPGRTVAVKTGTTDEKRDNYTIGYTPSYVVATWVGNNYNEPMNPQLASGLSGAAPIWNRVMSGLLVSGDVERFEMPNTVFAFVDEECGGLTEYFIQGASVPQRLCEPKKDKDEEKDEEKDKDDKKDKDDDDDD